MTNLTYTAQGTFDRNRIANINVCIPAESSAGLYTIMMYNLSRITSNGKINVIFCHFSDGSSVAMEHDNFDYRLNLNLDALITHSGAVDFDVNEEDALFIFFHNEKFDKSDRELYFQDCEEIYEYIKTNGNQSQEGLASNATLNNPRKVGLSLVTKVP